MVLEGRLVNKVVPPPVLRCALFYGHKNRFKGWQEEELVGKRNVSRAPLGSLAARINPKCRMNEWIWERGGLACSVKVLLGQTDGKTSGRNREYDSMRTQPNANSSLKEFWCYRVLPQGCGTGATAFPEQVLIYFPNKDISCKYLFVNMSCFHSYHRNMTDFQLISRQKVLVVDTELPAGVSLVDAKRALCPVPQWCLVHQKPGAVRRVCRTRACSLSGYVHVCAAVFRYIHIAVWIYNNAAMNHTAGFECR